MRLVAFAFCLFVVALGALGLVDPGRLVAFVRRFQDRWGLFLVAAIRIAFGGALFLIAVDTRHPALLYWLGLFVIAAGVVTPLVGVERFGRLLDWWAQRGATALRAWAAVALVFGLWLGYAVLPPLVQD